jgi:putative lipoprotein
VLLGLTLLATPSFARADDPDPWLGRDKAAHFAVSTGLAAAGYGVSTAIFEARGHALLLGGAVSLAIGAGKELLDLAGYGDPSWKDFTWDVIGTVCGLALAWSLDLVIRGVDEGHPVLAAPRGGSARALRVTF